jgi:hypothetical protein
MELKGCPFCGSVSIAPPYSQSDTYDCCSCDATVPIIWNTRPIENALNKQIAELEQRNKELLNLIADHDGHNIESHCRA